jgi:hypothetical protein
MLRRPPKFEWHIVLESKRIIQAMSRPDSTSGSTLWLVSNFVMMVKVAFTAAVSLTLG